MFADPVLGMLLRPRFPTAKLLDLREDLSDTNVYTFTNVNLGDLGTTAMFLDGNRPGSNTAYVPTPGRKLITVFVHAEDDAATFSATSLVMGDVSATRRVENAGTNAIYAGIFQFVTRDLIEETSRDIVITFDEAVTGCAIGVVAVEGMSNHLIGGSQSQNQSGNMDGALTGYYEGKVAHMGCSTCVTGGGTERFNATVMGIGGSNFEPLILYEASNAEFDYAAYFSFSPQLVADRVAIRGTWSGTGQGTMAYTTFFV